MLQSLIVENYGYSNRKNMDQYFLMKAEESQKPVMSLENFKDQMELSDKLDLTLQEDLLKETLQEVQHSTEGTLSQLKDSWANSRLESLAALRNNKKYRDLETNPFSLALVAERDQKMAEKLHELLEEEEGETTFVVINSLHLVGEDNIIEHLEEYGYIVENLFQE
ncbi:TraB/GumN family protein [Bacillus sp. JCM 19034]|uniref:TraB/GumN family protein n=1 Tax=Bacillus sp. JCM 19034 TaxID=1481928 RepID=UPI000782BEED|nr:TraB/GumN family protein [Bacillus sp. JCM 19034]